MRRLCVMDTLTDMFEPNTEFWLASVGTFAVASGIFWVVGSLFVLVDLTGKPACITSFKVQPGRNQPIDPARLLHTAKVSMFNQLLVGLPLGLLNAGLQRLRGCDLTFSWPHPVHILRDFVVFALLEEFGFYYSHRLLHHPALYRRIHKQHHEWTAPFSYVATYAHPVEYCLSNIVPLLLGPLVCGSPLPVTWAWFCVATLTTLIHHSGYHLPLLTSPEFHDFHHLRYNVNYGVTGLLDWFHGTDAKFRAAPQFKRHCVIYSSAPMKRLADPDTVSNTGLTD